MGADATIAVYLAGAEPARAEWEEPMASEPKANEASALEHTIDELAAQTGVPSRTIRFYQSKGALPAPQIRGRVAYYGPEHAERLELIATLQDRGLKLRAIRDLIQRADRGELVLGEWLGLESKLQAPWVADGPRLLDESAMNELLGTAPRGALRELVRLGLVEREKDSYLVRAPGLLKLTLKLHESGIDLETAGKAGDIARKHLGRMARELTEHFTSKAGRGFGRDATPLEIGGALESLRPLGLEAVQIIFAQEMERALRELIESGKVTAVPGRRVAPRA